ncbi:hypothetical protein QBZ16_004088 [Prototheca wickerhamii]|uniref:Orc1-like AAA ATPase domain-containing protein n=1 Tax=Prototheca wickerhamii TaxID=3111 RepID=A0AAD9IJC5_PROWI|nr:hypothetical protein QBZ16_004088 [Prototheca wickerhamii]
MRTRTRKRGTPSPGPSEAKDDNAADAVKQPRSREARTLELRPALREVTAALSSCFRAAVELGHGTSALVVGSRGSGKTLAVEQALAQLLREHDGGAVDARVGVVRLHGWAHADERLAFREAARQLAFGAVFKRSASVGENIEFLREMLDCLSRAQKCVIFVLEDFEAWVRRSRQTLLYGLLDALSCSGVRAAVVGTAVRADVTSLLEKRVRSRFSHRLLQVACPSAADGGAAVRAWLELPAGLWPDAELAERHNRALEAALADAQAARAVAAAAEAGAGLRPLALAAAAALRALHRAGDGALLAPATLTSACAALHAADGATARAAAGLSVLEAILAEVYAEFRRFSNLRGQHVDGYTLGAARRALDALLAVGVLAWANPARAARAACTQREHAALCLQLAPAELQRALERHPNCPTALREWFAKEGGLTELGTALLE